jgi:phosphate transport system substrate-binding protein
VIDMFDPNKTQFIFVSAVAAILMAACAAPATPAAAPTSVAVAPVAATEVPSAATEAMTKTEAMGEMVKLPDVDPLKLEGKVIAAGSSTVFPLTEKIAEMFKDEGFKGEVTIDSIGTGAGFERFCKGETDISNASRAINEKETAACKAAGIEPIEFKVGLDALAVVVNPANPVKNVTLAQLAAIYSGKVTNWKEIDPAFDAPIKLFSPGTDSGTFDYFVEVVLKKDKKPILEANPQLSENDNVLVQGVEGDKGAIGYFGYAYFKGEGSKLKALALEGVEPNEKTAEAGEYRLARPLFIYSTAKIMKAKPQVAGFINFYLGRVGEALTTVGYFPASAEALNTSMQNFVDASK